MRIGSMNNPASRLEDELRRIADAGFDLVDLALEPPHAWPCDGERTGRLLRDLGLAAVGHTAYYLPIASPFPGLRSQATDIFRAMLDVFAAAGIRLANVHPDPLNRLFAVEDVRARNAEAIAGLAEEAGQLGMTVMVENLGRAFGTVDDLKPILAADERVGFHLDVGHAHLTQARGQVNHTAALLSEFGPRLAHVHVHDNFGADDLHLPLGTGTIDWPQVVGSLKAAGWNGTATLEVFSSDRSYLDVSRRRWLEWWRDG